MHQRLLLGDSIATILLVLMFFVIMTAVVSFIFQEVQPYAETLLFHSTECDPPSNLARHKDQLTLILFLCFLTLDVLSLISRRSNLKVVALTLGDLGTVYNKCFLQKQGGSERLDSIVIAIRLKFIYFIYLLELCSTFFPATQSNVVHDLSLKHQLMK